MSAENASSTQRLSWPSCTTRRATARPTIASKAGRTRRRRLVASGKSLLDPARESTRAHRAQRLAESEGAELIGLADDRLSLGGELAPGDEQRCAGDLAPRLDPVELRRRLPAGAPGDALPAAQLCGDFAGPCVQLLATNN